MSGINGQTAIVTGGARGIGLAIAESADRLPRADRLDAPPAAPDEPSPTIRR